VRTPGSLEDLVGSATLLERSAGRFSDTESLLAAVRDSDVDAQRIWQDSIRALAAGIVSLINVLDPEVVILGGGITKAGYLLIEPLRASMQAIEWRPFGSGVPIVSAILGDWAGAIGAARFAMTYREDGG
jgi:glucokinase